jgi:hypothetical protein
VATEHQERQATNQALHVLANWMHEGISLGVSPLTDDLFTDSFPGGGDASKFTPSGHRGSPTSQLSDRNILDSNGGVAHKLPVQLSFDLNAGKGAWNNLVNRAGRDRIRHTHFRQEHNSSGREVLYLFSDASSDKAGDTFSFLLRQAERIALLPALGFGVVAWKGTGHIATLRQRAQF